MIYVALLVVGRGRYCILKRCSDNARCPGSLLPLLLLETKAHFSSVPVSDARRARQAGGKGSGAENTRVRGAHIERLGNRPRGARPLNRRSETRNRADCGRTGTCSETSTAREWG